jgi:hypothetical protein
MKRRSGKTAGDLRIDTLAHNLILLTRCVRYITLVVGLIVADATI